ncbi:hypothetical protein K461DRAFT_272937 [Myriangium duriaei CBS 260.36]|uniref:Uncharacterized protein n=1 Tax=Myriangium duriaei CBS 260.36 TaxID=1168546 RepID=A0A9P4JC00_9PEZI|nr:hypothetical protein K461DRAFT_272937 [Myriangium duriaei CBS 260.36]
MDLIKSLTGSSDNKEQQDTSQGIPNSAPDSSKDAVANPEQATDEQIANYLRHEYKSIRDDKRPNNKQ